MKKKKKEKGLKRNAANVSVKNYFHKRWRNTSCRIYERKLLLWGLLFWLIIIIIIFKKKPKTIALLFIFQNLNEKLNSQLHSKVSRHTKSQDLVTHTHTIFVRTLVQFQPMTEPSNSRLKLWGPQNVLSSENGPHFSHKMQIMLVNI